MKKQIVARMLDGRLYKGSTVDFQPNRPEFSIDVQEGPWKGQTVTLKLDHLKAIFFVKDLRGNRDYREKKLRIPRDTPGFHVLVTFQDGESLRGTATGLNLSLPGFYLFPSDPGSNNKRIFIVRSSVKDIKMEK